MSQPRILNIYLYPPMLHMARAGKSGFLNRLMRLLMDRDWQVQIRWSGDRPRAQAADQPGYALYHMEQPTHDRALTFRLAYHYPFWRLERQAQRWRWPVARAAFDPALVPRRQADDFALRLRRRVLGDITPSRGDHILVPLQGRLRQTRSFQVASPIDMLEQAAQTGRPTIATLHPKETLDEQDDKALAALAARYPNLTIGGNSAQLLPDCAFVVTQNSAVAFDGFILGKPAVLFAQSDFHHIALKAADLGAERAIGQAMSHQPDFAGYLHWFLTCQSLDMMAPDADEHLLAAMRDGGWPV